jgi:hypothetical protein
MSNFYIHSKRKTTLQSITRNIEFELLTEASKLESYKKATH